MSYIVVNTEGKVMWAVTCQDPCLDTYVGLDIVEDIIAPYPSKVYWDGVVLVDIPASPNPAYIFDYVTKTWIDLRTLQDTKDSKKDVMDSLVGL